MPSPFIGLSSRWEGSAYRMSAVALRAAIKRSDNLRDHCLRYVDLLMVQTSQAAA
jgi:hypothetical protein